MKSRLFTLLSALAATALSSLTAANLAQATEAPRNPACDDTACYYLAVFSSQAPTASGEEPDLFEYGTTHSFARFMKWKHDGSAEFADINWIPPDAYVTGTVSMFNDTVEGENRDIFAALDDAYQFGRQVGVWGPYAIEPALYQRALNQVGRLERHDIGYLVLDLTLRHQKLGADRDLNSRKALNCFHAISDVDIATSGYLLTLQHYGATASRMVVQHLKHWIVSPAQFDVAAAQQMGLYKHVLFQQQAVTDHSADLTATPSPALSYDVVGEWEEMPLD
jgi:hypothetical protein